jgi:hypothetical protein
MNNWQNELIGLTNLSGMHDEEDEQEELEEKRARQRRLPQLHPRKELPHGQAASFRTVNPRQFENPLIDLLKNAQHQNLSCFEFFAVLSNYARIHITDARDFDVSSLQELLIGLAVRTSSFWSACYLGPHGGRVITRFGYLSGEQAANHIIAINKSWRNAINQP